MDKLVELHRKIAPELVTVIEDRYNILRQIRFAQPIGRRALAATLVISERIARSHIDFLKAAGLISFSPLGMSITGDGNCILEDLSEYIRVMHGLSELERELAESLGLKRVLIIRGDSESDRLVQRELGRAAAGVLSQSLGNTMTIAVSGGSTMAYVAESITFQAPGTMVLPARGGLGELVEYQANTIAAVIANKLGGKYRLLHIPDGVGAEALTAILARDPNIGVISQMIKQADILLTGIGEAEPMSLRWGLDPATAEQLERRGAVGEMLGRYSTIEGEVVYTTSSVGVNLDDLMRIGKVIAVAGGRKKARAIMAVVAAGGQDVLITDEVAARAIQEIINNTIREEL